MTQPYNPRPEWAREDREAAQIPSQSATVALANAAARRAMRVKLLFATGVAADVDTFAEM